MTCITRRFRFAGKVAARASPCIHSWQGSILETRGCSRLDVLFARSHFCTAPRGPQTRLVRASCIVALGALVSVRSSGLAQSKDLDDDDSAKTATLPNIYLDVRTNYATVPANTLSIGFSSSSLSTALATLQTLSTLTNSSTLSALPTLSSPSSRSIGVDIPLTVDVTDRARCMAASVPALRRAARPTGRRSPSQAGMSDFRLTFMSRMAGSSRRLRCSRR